MKKLLSTALAVSILTTMNIAPALADIANTALPNLPDGVTNSNVTTNGANMNITVGGGTQGAVDTIVWKDYNIGKDATVNYEFTNHHQTSINKVNAAGGLSQIYGKITDTCGAGCGYNGTGKIILLNPNGVIFGDGANVNVNSFTVSTFNGTYDQATNKLQLDRNGQSQGITVKNAQIRGDKGVNLISDQVITYSGSQISTNVVQNYTEADGTNTAYGKVKIFTADGVNFEYGVSGIVKKTDEALITSSNDKMLINLQGEINSGNIDVRNYSKNVESEINLNGATLKATKAVNGNNGNIWLISENKAIIDKSNIITQSATGAESRTGGNLLIMAGDKVSLNNTNVDVVGNADISSNLNDVVVNASNVKANGDISLTATKGISSIQENSTVKAKDISIVGGKRAQVVNSTVAATNNYSMQGHSIWMENAKVTAGNELTASADLSYPTDEETGIFNQMNLTNATLKANKITLNAKDINGDADLTGSKAIINAGNDINLKLKNVGNRNNGLVAEAGNDMSIETEGDLSVSSLISGRNMKLKASRIISGYDKTSNILREEGDSADRAYIEVGGTFESDPNYTVTDSADLTADGQYNQRHHIQYGDGSEKILLVTKLPYSAPDTPGNPPIVDPTPDTPDPGPTPPVIIPPIDDGESIPAIDINDDQAAMALKLPQKPQHIANVNNISDGRTTFIDVFAAASQIEVDDEE